MFRYSSWRWKRSHWVIFLALEVELGLELELELGCCAALSAS